MSASSKVESLADWRETKASEKRLADQVRSVRRRLLLSKPNALERAVLALISELEAQHATQLKKLRPVLREILDLALIAQAAVEGESEPNWKWALAQLLRTTDLGAGLQVRFDSLPDEYERLKKLGVFDE